MDVLNLAFWELLSYIVTVFGLPLAIFAYFLEQRKERENEDEEVYQQLSDAYIDFLKLLMANPDLKLTLYMHEPALQARNDLLMASFTEEQQERLHLLFEILISLFERAYLLAYEPDMAGKQLRRWRSWDDYMRDWCNRPDFRALLPKLLTGEDRDFAEYINLIAEEQRKQMHELMV
jgi:hypothetical protein